MKKLTRYIILLLLVLISPIKVKAGGSSDDNSDTMGVSHMNINCVYEQQSYIPMTHGELEGNGTYINMEFVGIDDLNPGTSFTYSFGNLSADGIFEKNYEYVFARDCDKCDRWLNFFSTYGSEYFLQAWWQNQMMGENHKTLSGSAIQKKADNGDFCPKQILIVQSKEGDKYFFVSARDDTDRIASQNELNKSGKYKNQQIYFFTGTTLAISNINQETLEDTNANEKVEEGKQNVENYCDENSPNYDEKKCTESKIVSSATLDTAENIISYNPVSDVELEKIELGKVTCATIFTEEVNGVVQYNSTHQLLSTTLKFMQYLGIILATVLSIVDFVKVVPTQDKDAIKKASTKAVTRLIIAIVIFFVPIIVDFILGLVGFNDPTCGLL